MWYLGEWVTPQHNVRGRFVPMDPPESMLVKIVDVARLYSDAMEAGGQSICLPWENFVDRRSLYDDILARLAPPVRFVPPEAIDPEDVPYDDRVLRYVDSDGKQAPRARVRRWMLVIDFLKRNCVNLTKKLTGKDIEERRRGRWDSVDRGPPVDTSREQAGWSLGQGPSPSAGARQRHSGVDRGAVPSTYAEPT
ncbi:hypothetical protein SOVF_132530 [Spinacia oleracea]|nr:hypothetical protein SOVF_132530 [Spinacia oleracea]